MTKNILWPTMMRNKPKIELLSVWKPVLFKAPMYIYTYVYIYCCWKSPNSNHFCDHGFMNVLNTYQSSGSQKIDFIHKQVITALTLCRQPFCNQFWISMPMALPDGSPGPFTILNIFHGGIGTLIVYIQLHYRSDHDSQSITNLVRGLNIYVGETWCTNYYITT